MRVMTAFQPAAGAPGRKGHRRLVRKRRRCLCEVVLRRRRAACSSCGQVCRSIHDRLPRHWRHLDLADQHLSHRVRPAACPLHRLGVRVEAVTWARPPSSAHARLRGPHRLPVPADGEDADRRAASRRLGHRGRDRRPGRLRPPRRVEALRARPDRRRRGELPPR